MRALRRIATPASVAAVLGGCAFPVDDFRPPSRADAGLTTNGDAANLAHDSAPGDSASEAAVEDSGADSAPPCECVKQAGPNCKEWSPPGCGE